MSLGLCLRVTHTGVAQDSVALYDIEDGVDLLGSYRKPGPVYVPVNQTVELVYTSSVALSYEVGSIRVHVTNGLLTATIVLGPDFPGGGSGDVVGPGSATDEALARFDGATGKLIQNSVVTLDDTGNLSGVVNLDITGTLDVTAGSLLVPQGLTPSPTVEGEVIWDTDDNHLVVGDGTGTVTILDDGTVAGGDLSGTYPNPTVTDLTITSETQGSVLYFNGSNWVVLVPGTSGQFLRTNGAGANPVWATSSGSGDVIGPGSSTDHALVRWDGATGTVVQDSTAILTDTGSLSLPNGESLSVDTIQESTASNGVVLSGTRHYADSATNPVSPTPADGDRYYNTVLGMDMRYDTTRSKWLSVEAATFSFGRNGNTAGGSYYKGIDGISFSATIGYPAFFAGTVVALGYTRDDLDSATFEVTANGATAAVLASAAVAGQSTTLNGDFASTSVLAVRNSAASNTTTGVAGWVRVKWRV